MSGERWKQKEEKWEKKRREDDKRYAGYLIAIILTIVAVWLVWAVHHGGWAYAWEQLLDIWWDD